MYEALSLPRLLKALEHVFEALPDTRAGGPNTQYAVADAAKGAFAAFFTQQASFLAHQWAMQVTKGRRYLFSVQLGSAAAVSAKEPDRSRYLTIDKRRRVIYIG